MISRDMLGDELFGSAVEILRQYGNAAPAAMQRPRISVKAMKRSRGREVARCGGDGD